MRGVVGAIALVVAASACHGAQPVEGAVAHAPDCMTIVSWNDLHGQLRADQPFLDTHLVPAGGVVALADYVAEERAKNAPVFVLDAGDLFTGPMESTMSEGAPVIAAYRVLGVDAAAVGNHEFDFGPVGYDHVFAAPGKNDASGAEGPRGALLARMADASFPFLSSNVSYASGQPVAWNGLKPYVTIERGGFRIGVVGYTTDETPRTTIEPNVHDLSFTIDAAKRVAANVRAVRATGAAPVVLLAHASLEGELPQTLDDAKDQAGMAHKGEMARLLAALGPDLPDLVIAGHRHAWMLGRVRGVPIVSTDQHGVGFARIQFCRASKAETPVLRSIDREVAFASNPPRTELGRKVDATVAPYVDAVRLQAEEVVTVLPQLCLPQGAGGTAFAEQVARALLETANAAGIVPKDLPAIAVMNAGGIRSALFPGPLRVRDVFAALPFENAVSTCTTTKRGAARALSNLLERSSSRDRFPFGLAGASLTAHRTKTGLALDALQIPGAEPEDAKVALVIPDFLLYGGDAFLEGVSCTDRVTTTTRVRDAFRILVAREKGGCGGTPENIRIEVP